MALTTKGSAVAVRSTAQTLLVATGDAPTDLGQHFSIFVDHLSANAPSDTRREISIGVG